MYSLVVLPINSRNALLLSIGHGFMFAVTVSMATMICTNAQAQVFKCVSPAGKVEFSSAPCPQGVKQSELAIKPNTVDTSAEREQILRSENQKLRQQLDSNRSSPTVPAAAQLANESNRLDSSACQRARRDYEIAAGSIENNQALIRARESAMYGQCGMREPDRNTTNVQVNNNPDANKFLTLPPKQAASR